MNLYDAVPDEVKELIEKVSKNGMAQYKQQTWSVYMHMNKQNYKKYIGMTQRLPKERWSPSCYVYCPLFYPAIEAEGFDAFAHIVLVEVHTKEEAERLEKYFIKYWNTQDPEYGYNVSSGGKANWELSQEAWTKRRIRTSGTNNNNARAVTLFDISGKRIADFDTITKCAEYLGKKGRTFRFNNKGTVMGHLVRYKEDVEGVDQLPPEELIHPHAQLKQMKKINQYDCNGHYIKTFPSLKDASLSINTSPSSTMRLHKALSGYAKTAYGYQWRYAAKVDGTNDIDPVVSMKGKVEKIPLDMIDIETGEVLRSFQSISEAVNAIGIRNARLTFYDWLHGHKHQDNIMYGYRWAISPKPGAG